MQLSQGQAVLFAGRESARHDHPGIFFCQSYLVMVITQLITCLNRLLTRDGRPFLHLNLATLIDYCLKMHAFAFVQRNHRIAGSRLTIVCLFAG